MTDRSDSFVDRLSGEGAHRELLREVGQVLAETLQEKLLARLPSDATEEAVERAYPHFLKEHPELATLVEAMSDGTATPHQAGEFLLVRDALESQKKMLKEHLLDISKLSMMKHGLPEEIALSGKMFEDEAAQVRQLAKANAEDPAIVEAAAAVRRASQDHALYNEVYNAMIKEEVSSAIAANGNSLKR